MFLRKLAHFTRYLTRKNNYQIMYSCAFVSSIAVLIFVLNADVVSLHGDTYNSKIKFYTGPTAADFVSYDLATAENVADHPSFNSTRKNMIFFHGWGQSPQTPASQILIDAYLANGNFNILALDWSEAASYIFVDVVVQRVKPLGIAVASYIDRWYLRKGVPFSKIHLVGHSLGAHLAGSVGKFTQEMSRQTNYIDRITGLDPGFAAVDYLQPRYARFVDSIHTDPNGYGTNQNTGHVDFWPNYGAAFQPGCSPITTDIACSHRRAFHLYAESVRRADRAGNFLSTNSANPNIKIEMGLNCPASARGIYTLHTNGDSWYSQS